LKELVAGPGGLPACLPLLQEVTVPWGKVTGMVVMVVAVTDLHDSKVF